MQVDYTGVIQKADYTGLIRGSYVVRHRVTGEFCTVELGARYNQREAPSKYSSLKDWTSNLFDNM